VDENRINELIESYEAALLAENIARFTLADAQGTLKLTQATTRQAARDEGKLDGKNAEARSDQATILLADAAEMQKWVEAVADLENRAAAASIDRKIAETRLKMARALLYSQGGKNVTLNA